MHRLGYETPPARADDHSVIRGVVVPVIIGSVAAGATLAVLLSPPDGGEAMMWLPPTIVLMHYSVLSAVAAALGVRVSGPRHWLMTALISNPGPYLTLGFILFNVEVFYEASVSIVLLPFSVLFALLGGFIAERRRRRISSDRRNPTGTQIE